MTSVKKYKINLNDKPEDRWKHIYEDNQDNIQKLRVFMDEQITKQFHHIVIKLLFPILFFFLNIYSWFSRNEYVRELKGISKRFNLSFSKLLLLNVGYDFVAHCTSVVCYDKINSRVWHLRNMDWDGDLLRDLTIDVEFYKDNLTMYRCTTWLGFVGILTGMRCQQYELANKEKRLWYPMCISLNYRKENGYRIRNIFNIIRGYTPCGIAIRQVLETVGKKIDEIKMIAPCYITVATTRYLNIYEVGCNNCVRYYKINYNMSNMTDYTDQKIAFLVQTNTDYNVKQVDEYWCDGDELLINSVDRKNKMVELLKNTELTHDNCVEMLKTEPVFNDETVYTTIMSVNIDETEMTYDSLRFTV